MRTGLPDNHNLPDLILSSGLLYHDTDGQISLTDVQYDALENGVASGRNVLAIAPTSSGKTEVGLFAAAAWLVRYLSDGGKVVFLTSHRALARQKFEEIISKFSQLLSISSDEIVLSTGDDVINANRDIVTDALSASIVVATYEKYLNMLAGAGIQKNLAKTCFVADEIQIIGDASRGQNVEILLTIIKRSAGQIVGLSAVIEDKYAKLLSQWLGAVLVKTSNREIELIYELRSPDSTFVTSTKTQSSPQIEEHKINQTIQALKNLLKSGSAHEPIAVFCMSKKQVFDLAKEWEMESKLFGAQVISQDLPLFREPTTSSDELTRYLPHNFAYHTADLNEDERVAVEICLDDSKLKVVFATTTLASGLNYSFKTVIIHSWKRWNSKDRIYDPISRSEFHNMAGRAGRLSHVNTAGKVIYFSATKQETRMATKYLEWWVFDEFEPRIDPTGFSALSLQLLAAQVAEDEKGLCDFLQSTFSAERELERNAGQPQIWANAVGRSFRELTQWGFIA